ncbi:MAG: hypothetical protein H0V44_00775 [Planctomycetes bacterium]|nr:hypothetical protein [Planctomycetota bacterium]
MILHYAGNQRHPAGEQAALSWVNDEGRGLIRLLQDGGPILVLQLHGPLPQEHQPIARRTGSRGPSRSSDLWVVVVAWSLPAGFTASEIADITGISTVTVRDALVKLQAIGLVDHDPRRASTYLPCIRRGEVLHTFLTERWSEWRLGTGTPSLRPIYRSFAAIQEWNLLYRRLQPTAIRCFPTGVTALEGGPDTAQRAWLLPSGLDPEVHCYVAAEDTERFAETAQITLLPPDRANGTSSVCLLAADHPAMRLVAHRRAKGFYQPAWPWGLAALDAYDHPDARVRQVADEALRGWITNQSIEIGKHQL